MLTLSAIHPMSQAAWNDALEAEYLLITGKSSMSWHGVSRLFKQGLNPWAAARRLLDVTEIVSPA